MEGCAEECELITVCAAARGCGYVTGNDVTSGFELKLLCGVCVCVCVCVMLACVFARMLVTRRL